MKTRLAAALGAPRALAIYRAIGRRVVREMLGAPGRSVVVRYTPARSESLVRAWLGAGPVYAPQPDGDLGARIAQAMTEAFEVGAPRVVVVGTDCPDVSGGTIAEAFRRLRCADVVVGPALDGGYYLVGTAAPRPALFHGIPWSTPAVLSETCASAERLGLRVSLLDPLRDIDTADDWRAWRAATDGGRAHSLRPVDRESRRG